MKLLRNVIVFFMVMSFLPLIASCGGQDSSENSKSESPSVAAPVAEGLEGPIAELPIVITSAGQSADVKMVESLIRKGGVDYSIDVVLDPSGLGNAGTIIIVIGGSSKGLGAAGIDIEDELSRVSSVIDAAKNKGMIIIGMHIGGEGRRGELSDRFIHATVEDMDYLIVVEGGDDDGLFSAKAANHNIPLVKVAGIVDSYDALMRAFPSL